MAEQKGYQKVAAAREELEKEAIELYKKHKAAGMLPLASIVFKPRGDEVEVRFIPR